MPTNSEVRIFPQKTSIKDKTEDYPKLFHEDIEIKLFIEGESALIIDKNTYHVSKGEIVVINPYEFHSTVDIGKNKGKYHLFMIGLDFFGDTPKAPDLRNYFFSNHNRFKNHIKEDCRIKEILTKILNENQEKQDGYETIIYSLTLELIALLKRNYKSDDKLNIPNYKNIRYYEIIYPAIKKIRTDYADKITIDMLSALCNISKHHFCRIFKAVTGDTALNYLNEHRLKMADIFLENSNKSISEISEICGFPEPAYFSRFYKNHMGISPTEKRAILSK